MQLQTHSRETESLSGSWTMIPDTYDEFGENGSQTVARIFDPAFDNGMPDNADLDDGYDVTVPGCWNEQQSAFEQYEGVMWYARRVSATSADERRLLRFGAVNYRADVWLNGEKLGHHEGGFTPFAFEVTDELEAREDNLLVVKVDNSRAQRTLPAETTDWFNFGGITREVELVSVPEQFLRNLSVDTDRSGEDVTISVTAYLDGPASEAPETLEAALPGLNRSWTLEATGRWEEAPHLGADTVDSGTVFEGTHPIPESAVDLWTPGSPALYDLEVESDADTLGERVGFRTISVDGDDVLLNGEPISLDGIALHEEADGRGRSLGPADRQERFEWLAELNCNFARLAHYPHHEAMARRADEAGVLLWEEVPAYWSVEFGDETVQAHHRQQLRELVQRDWNRPSVALWSIANETDHDSAVRNDVLPEMAAHVRELDSTRLVTAACFMAEEDGRFVIDDPVAEHLDVFGINQYLGWYGGEPDEFDRFDSDPDGPPIVVSEVGGAAEYGTHGPVEERWSEEFQANIYREQVEAMDAVEQVAGITPWILFDFRSPRRQNPHQRGYNRKGILDEDGNRKAAFDILQGYYDR